ncbi:sugar-transfer associated ATP-grasp domain-containing protein [Dongia sedimenti]|uniref:Sugar-transfer associated ATP-grasp domain-containing protein n=1 Tax=Dongia sedimenti TaxID=3064282 RepID=A0ABU0YHU9_9PROT|nr:sugar-transfer associated ATP-grasp domain-containing protein [Rhodospirillaceae bacterium R-7]
MNRLLKKSYAPHFLIGGTVLAIGFSFAAAPASYWLLNALCGIAALVGVWLVGIRLAYQSVSRTARRAWQVTLVLLLLVAIREFGGPALAGIEESSGLDRLMDGLVLVTAFVALWLTSTLDEMPHYSRALLWSGFLLHLVTTGLDLGGGEVSAFLAISPEQLGAIVKLSQFLCLQLYLFGALAFIGYLRWQVFKLDRPSDVGDLARRVFAGQTLVHRYTYPRVWYLGFPGGRPMLTVARFVYWFTLMARPVHARGWKSPWRQLLDLFLLFYRHGLDAQAYYMFELYRPNYWPKAGGYLTRYETKNGIIKLLTWQLKDYDNVTVLADKLKFAAFCTRIGVPTPPLLGIARDGVLTLEPGAADKLDQDLFIKPVKSKGSRGIDVFRNIAPGRYRDEAGGEIDRATLVERVAERSKTAALMVQQRLANHPAIADLADQSLMAVRVITCKSDLNEQAIVTYAFVRVITRLEPAWPVTYELGIAIDLATGELGPATGDKERWLLEWWDVHPVTGAQVTGRQMPCWEEIKAVAVKAHNAARGRLLVGWDIAVTKDGPLVLEGNSYPDVDFPQRVCRVGIGHSPLGAPLHAALVDLERRIATGTVKRPPGASL